MSGRKKVLIDLECLKHPNSGISNVFKNLIKGLAEIQSMELRLFLFGEKQKLINIGTDFSVHRVKKWHKILFFMFYKYDVIHVSNQLSSYFHYKLKSQKKIVTLHDLNFLHEVFDKKHHQSELNKVRKNIENADVIVCISEFTKSDFLQNQSLFNFKKEPSIEVIHNGIRFPKKDEMVLEYFENELPNRFILNLGVFFSKKNQLALIRMLPYVEEDLVLVASGGSAAYEELVRKEIVKLNLENRVHILKNISDNQKWTLIQSSSAMCHPSLAEGFGLPVIEAMYFGKPVFLSNLTSLPEIGGEYAFYFDDFETLSMVEVYKKGMKRYTADIDNYKQQLNTRALFFDYKKTAKKYADLYDTIVL